MDTDEQSLFEAEMEFCGDISDCTNVDMAVFNEEGLSPCGSVN
jgi:hypothetical protein